MNLRSVAKALGGHVSGRQVVCPGPGHSRRDRSLSVRLEPNAPDGFICHSHAGDDWRVCRDYVREQLGLPKWEPGDEQNRTAEHIREFDESRVEQEMGDMDWSEDDLDRIQKALKIWNEADSPGDMTETYLRSRALDPPQDLYGAVFREHLRCPWRDENIGQTIFVPCLIAAYRNVFDDGITGIHRIRLDQGPKPDRRMRGISKLSAIKFAPAGPKLALGEGIESCLAARQLGINLPVWAAGSVPNITFFPIVDGVDELHVLVEHDETTNASANAFRICGKRWRLKAGRKIFRILPSVGKDLNDVLMMGARR
jgi:putative DNA primase/helicase